MMEVWQLVFLVGDLKEASATCNLPYNSTSTYTGSFSDCNKLAGYIHREWGKANGYRYVQIKPKRVINTITYTAKSGKSELVILTIERL